MKILHIDIETVPNLVYSFRLGKQVITADKIHTPSRVVCFAAKWDGKSKMTFCDDFYSDPGDARQMAEEACRLLDEADVVVTYNGSRFDLPLLRALMVENDLTPPSSFFSVDLFDTVKREFDFPSYSLGYVAKALGVGEKEETGGFVLWRNVMEGDDAAIRKMKKYNIQDVRVQEGVYHQIRPWIRKHPNPAVFNPGADRPACSVCGSESLQRRGFYVTQTQRYRRFFCTDCGGWSKERTTELLPEQRKNVLSRA